MKHYFFLATLFCSLFSTAQELARRPLLGIQMEKITEDTKRIMDLPSTKGVLVNLIISGSSAEKAGFLTGDVLLKINDKEVNSPAETMQLVASYKGGDPFTYELIRKHKVVTGKSVFKDYPSEKYNDISMLYTSTKTLNGVQRIIVSKLKNKEKSPVVVFIGGIGCYSLDNPLDTTRSETQLLNSLTRAGYVCVRAEKPGVGDNMQCTPCAEVSFMDELDGYIKTVNAVKKYSYVDSSRVYIIGHSMGGVMAPLVAQKTRITGIIAYGTIGSNFIEYLLKTRRTIGEAYQWPAEQTDEYVKDCCECSSYYFIEKMTTQQAGSKKEICKEYLSVFDLRSRKYNDELYQLNIPAAWKLFSGKALLLWGEGDYIASKEDHQIITNTINSNHPGNATFSVVKSSTHALMNASSFQEAVKSPGAYNPNAANDIINWLKQS